jgi:hypothetical protein
VARRNVIGIVVAVMLAAAVASGFFLLHWLRRAQPLPADELLKIEIQLDAEPGVTKAHILNRSDFRLRDVTVRVVALRPKGAASEAPDNGGWQIATSWCTFDPVSKPVEYDKVVDRQIRFGANLTPGVTGDARTASDFVPGTDYWECRIIGANGFK